MLTTQTQAVPIIDDSRVWLDLYEVLKKYAEKYTLVSFQGIQFDLRRINDKRYFVKKANQLITSRNTPTDSNPFQTRALLVEWLEKFLRTQFRNSRDFKRKIERYLKGYEVRKRPVSERIKKARKKKKWTQKQLADHLSFKTHVSITQYEKGLRYPPKKVFQWLEELGM